MKVYKCPYCEQYTSGENLVLTEITIYSCPFCGEIIEKKEEYDPEVLNGD